MTPHNTSRFALTLFISGLLPLSILLGMFWDIETVMHSYTHDMTPVKAVVLFGLLPMACMSLAGMTLASWYFALILVIKEGNN